MSRRGDRPDARASGHALDGALVAAVRRTGAAVGGIYLLDAQQQVLCLVVTGGLPPEYAEPWTRVALATPDPVADAGREDRLVWVGGLEELARCYPRAATPQPYRFCMAAAPISGPGTCCGALLLWPAGHSPRAGHRERARTMYAAHRISGLLKAAGEQPVIPEQPRLVHIHDLDTRRPQAAVGFAERLPGGSLALDTKERITFVTSGAARLLDCDPDQLLGRRPGRPCPGWTTRPTGTSTRRHFSAASPCASMPCARPVPGWTSTSSPVPTESASAWSRPRSPTGHRPWCPSAPYGQRAGRGEPPVSADAPVRGPHRGCGRPRCRRPGVRPGPARLRRPGPGAVRGRGRTIEDHRPPGLPARSHRTPRRPAPGHQHHARRAGSRQRRALPLRRPGRDGPQLPAGTTARRQQAWAFLPLIVSGRPVGCCILSYDRPHTFTADERAVLTSLAGLIAQALDRARLYDTKHHLAHSLQQTLLPRTLPLIDGLDVAARYLPASHGMDIGGDFYDVIRLNHHSAAADIGDVQGHNTATAALMGQVRTAVHAHATAGATPDQVLARTNRVLTDLEPDLLVSCLYTHIDLTRHQITLASAGHPPPLMRRPDRHTAVLTVEPGPLLGIHADALCPLTTASLPANTLLALYTDGLVEVPGKPTAPPPASPITSPTPTYPTWTS